MPSSWSRLQRPHLLGDRVVLVEAVQVQQVDPLRTQPAQAQLGLLAQIGGVAERHPLGGGGPDHTDLGGHRDGVAVGVERLGEEFLARPQRVRVGRVEEGDARLGGRPQQGQRGRPVGRGRPDTGLGARRVAGAVGEAHRAVADAPDREVAPELEYRRVSGVRVVRHVRNRRSSHRCELQAGTGRCEGVTVKIGELSRETGVGVRLLRYYEEQGLLASERTPGGQRVYGPDAPAVVRRIRALLGAGLPTRVIAEVLDCVCGSEAEVEPCLSPMLVAQLDAIDEKIHGLQDTRSSLAALVAVTEKRQLAADEHVMGIPVADSGTRGRS